MPATNPALSKFWSHAGWIRGGSKVPVRYRVLYGGRNSTKTWDATTRLIYLSITRDMRVLCVRRLQNRIDESVYRTIKTNISRLDLESEFDIQAQRLYARNRDSMFVFLGIERHIEEIKGFEGADILYIEEAEKLTEEQWMILQPTIRKQGSEIWIIFNPRLATDFVYRNFVIDPPPDAIVRKINYDENPFLTTTAHADIESLRKKDPELFGHVYLGNPKSSDELAIVKRVWLESCIDAHCHFGLEVAGAARIGFDVADEGADANALCLMRGFCCVHLEEWQGREDQLLQSCRRVYSQAVLHDASIRYDSIGVGAHAGAAFGELNQAKSKMVKYRKFNAAAEVVAPEKEYVGGVMNKDHFVNLKAQTWQMVADCALATHNAVNGTEPLDHDRLLSLDANLPHLERLITELSSPHREYSLVGAKMKVESKKDLLKRGIASHNLADAFVMAAVSLPEPMSKLRVGKYGIR